MNLNVTKTTADYFSYGGRSIQYLLLSAMLCLRTLQVFLTGLALLYPFAEVSFFQGVSARLQTFMALQAVWPLQLRLLRSPKQASAHTFIYSFILLTNAT